jgi:multidrug resistance protein
MSHAARVGGGDEKTRHHEATTEQTPAGRLSLRNSQASSPVHRASAGSLSSSQSHDVSLAEPGDDVSPRGPLERTTTAASSISPPYSVFTRKQKIFIVFMASFAGIFSPISGQIYLPALNTLARDLNVSNALINLTLTSYMIFQGLAPAFIGDIADTMGRRPAYAICFVVYIAANIGLALQDNYAALFVLRCVQSSGSSGTIAMAAGVVADVATAAERGSFMGYTLAGSLLGPAIGPVLGGVLSQYLGWQAIFWFLCIMGAVFLVPFTIWFPETARTQVGDGSIPPQKWNMSLMNYLAVRKARKAEEAGELPPPDTSRFPPRPKPHFPNPLSSLRIILDKLNACLLFYNAFLFGGFYQISSAIPSQFQQIYGFNDFQIGLCFIPYGIGAILAALVVSRVTAPMFPTNSTSKYRHTTSPLTSLPLNQNGQLLDRNFRRFARKLSIPLRPGRQTDLTHFPIERARLQIALPAIYTTLLLILAFGWTLHFSGPLPLLLVILFFQSLTMSMAFNVTSTLLIDYYPGKSATATAANNLVRCLLGAGATAAIVPMIESWGRGWAFTALVGFLGVTSPLVWAVWVRGERWRGERREREEERRKDKEKGLEEGHGVGAQEGKKVVVGGAEKGQALGSGDVVEKGGEKAVE